MLLFLVLHLLLKGIKSKSDISRINLELQLELIFMLKFDNFGLFLVLKCKLLALALMSTVSINMLG